MKSTISINKDDFENDAKNMVVITADEQRMILQTIETMEAQAQTARALLRSIGFAHYITCDNPRTIARLNLTVKGQSDDS